MCIMIYPIMHYTLNRKVFFTSFATNTKPTSYAEAIKDPRCISIMQAEIEALEGKRI